MKALLLLAVFAAAHALPPAPRASRTHAETGAAGQQARAGTSIQDLLAGLKSKDEDASADAADALEKRGAEAVPFLEQFLKTERGDDYRLRAAVVLAEIEPDDAVIVPTLLRIAKGRSLFDSEKTLQTRRSAGMLLSLTPAGIRTLPALLKDEDTFVRRSAAFALDDPTEVLADLSPALRAAIYDVMPALTAALGDKDEVVHEMCCEVLAQIYRSKVEPLSSRAEELLKQSGKTRGDCLCECD